MSRTRHPRPPAQRDELASIRNRAAALADAITRVQREQTHLKRAVDEAREQGATEADIIGAVRLAYAGRPDRAKALEEWTKPRIVMPRLEIDSC